MAPVVPSQPRADASALAIPLFLFQLVITASIGNRRSHRKTKYAIVANHCLSR